ncbi:MAG: acetolactate synthase small subunit [Dehalococcoidia bacterium]|nr:acetolactate synthase small subunit [Dehalococcoidia bacterium]
MAGGAPKVKRHTVVALVEDKPGVLNRIVSLFRRRGFNIVSLTVGPSEMPELSRLTIVVGGDTVSVEQVVKQLYKLIEVIKVNDISEEEMVARELALIKVAAADSRRLEIMHIVQVYQGKILDMSPDSLIIEMTGAEDKIESFVQVLRPFGIKEMVRTGRAAMVRGSVVSAKLPEEVVHIFRGMPSKADLRRMGGGPGT